MRLRAMLVAALLLVPNFILFGEGGAAAADRCFPETDQCISGLFYQYWEQNGGLAQQGYPITDEFSELSPLTGLVYRVQYFERARFEYHPEYAGTPYEVLLGQLGREQYLAKYPAGRPAGGTGEVCFDATERCIRGIFFQYWQQNGGLAQQGYPLSDEFDEVSPTNGQTYRVQYFERARFEYHPEHAGTPYEVLLGLLGREQFLAKPIGQGGLPTGAPVAELIGKTFTVKGVNGEPLAVQVVDARRLAVIPAGNGGAGATAPAGSTFVVVFYNVTNVGRDDDTLADDLCLQEGGRGRCTPPDDWAIEAATLLYDYAGPYEYVSPGPENSLPGLTVYLVPADAGDFSLGSRRR